MPERLAQLAPGRHGDDFDEVDDRKRAHDAIARPALLIAVRNRELALLPDGPAHECEVKTLRLRRAPGGRDQADVVAWLLGAGRQGAGHHVDEARDAAERDRLRRLRDAEDARLRAIDEAHGAELARRDAELQQDDERAREREQRIEAEALARALRRR